MDLNLTSSKNRKVIISKTDKKIFINPKQCLSLLKDSFLKKNCGQRNRSKRKQKIHEI